MTEISFARYSSLILRHNIDILRREIVIIGDITTKSSIKLDKQLKVLEATSEDITIILNTYGGSIQAAFAMADRIRNSMCKINIIGTGVVMSAGLTILVSGTTRRATELTTFMHHGLSSANPNYESIATQENELKSSKELDRVRFKHLAARTKKPYSFWASTGKHTDHVFSAQQALDYGLIEEVI